MYFNFENFGPSKFSVIYDWIFEKDRWSKRRLPFLAFGVTGVVIFIYIIQNRKKKRKVITFSEEDVIPDLPNFELYRNQIPSDPNDLPNLGFYRNQIPSEPNGDYIEDILTYWSGNYDKLEKDHSFVKWLFPNRTPDISGESHILMDEEAKIISGTPELRDRVKKAFEMMLDFYGMKLTWNDQFELAGNCEERLAKLNQCDNQNFKRISRILLALKELGHKDLMLPWMKFIYHLIYVENSLDQAQSSFEKHWINTLDAMDKMAMQRYSTN